MSAVEDLETHILSKFNILQRLGKGAYGVVWRAASKDNKEEVAIKKVYDAFHNSTDAQRTFREVMFLKQLSNHENIVKLKDLIRAQSPNDLYLVFEFMEIDLHEVIKGKILEEVHKPFIIYQILKGLKYIHSANVIHRDLKPSNILLNRDCLVKIADFGLARLVTNDEEDQNPQILTDYIATRWYRAPEIVLGSQHYSKAIDVWSVGCILAEMIIGKAPFPGKSTINQIEMITELLGRPSKEDLDALEIPLTTSIMDHIKIPRQKSFAHVFAGASPEALDLLKKLLAFNPKKRITIQEALEHPYLAEFHRPEEETEFGKALIVPLDDNIKLSRNDYRKALHRLIEEKEAEAERNLKKDQLNLIKGDALRRSLSRGTPAPATTQATAPVDDQAKLQAEVRANSLNRAKEKLREKAASQLDQSFNAENALKKSYFPREDSQEQLARKASAGRSKYTDQTTALPQNSYLGTIEKVTRDLMNESKYSSAYSKYENQTKLLHGSFVASVPANKKLLNQSIDKIMAGGSVQGLKPSVQHDENKENRKYLANLSGKEKYDFSNLSHYAKMVKQGDVSGNYSFEGSGKMAPYPAASSSFHSIQQPSESLKAAYLRQLSSKQLPTSASFTHNTSGTASLDAAKQATFNAIGARILKKLKKSPTSTGVSNSGQSSMSGGLNAEQILKSGGVYDHKYLYNAIANSNKSRGRL